MDLVALRHVGSSQTKDQTHVFCIGKQILIHCATRELHPWIYLHIWLFIYLGEVTEVSGGLPTKTSPCALGTSAPLQPGSPGRLMTLHCGFPFIKELP